ncbi:hypothetical protein EX30DRAFT_158736 [Ascodesmis nigricans]|uniref:Uncharacterized protein n=1 Tax=Ascodesmis nigricans TaxID=341454 RepID=A0A4S2MS24_9PEZI|nr:hypothetical protein EX30DRAFT_158736 [Ascodesmis nigricans]
MRMGILCTRVLLTYVLYSQHPRRLGSHGPRRYRRYIHTCIVCGNSSRAPRSPCLTRGDPALGIRHLQSFITTATAETMGDDTYIHIWREGRMVVPVIPSPSPKTARCVEWGGAAAAASSSSRELACERSGAGGCGDGVFWEATLRTELPAHGGS